MEGGRLVFSNSKLFSAFLGCFFRHFKKVKFHILTDWYNSKSKLFSSLEKSLYYCSTTFHSITHHSILFHISILLRNNHSQLLCLIQYAFKGEAKPNIFFTIICSMLPHKSKHCILIHITLVEYKLGSKILSVLSCFCDPDCSPYFLELSDTELWYWVKMVPPIYFF